MMRSPRRITRGVDESVDRSRRESTFAVTAARNVARGMHARTSLKIFPQPEHNVAPTAQGFLFSPFNVIASLLDRARSAHLYATALCNRIIVML